MTNDTSCFVVIIVTRCIRTQVYGNRRETFGQFAPLNANESLTIVFERSSDGENWTQSAIVNGQVVSQVRHFIIPPVLHHISGASLI